jgi:hypothetical protein
MPVNELRADVHQNVRCNLGRRVLVGCGRRIDAVTKFLLWMILLVLCWPLAFAALFLYPIVWLLLLPFRLLGIAVDGVLQLVKAVVLLPATILKRV